MSGTVITFTSGKGGVGKTTTVANIATALAMLGKRVVAIDADIGLRNLDIVMGLESRIIYDVIDVVEQRCQLRQALVRDTRVDSLFLLPAAQTRNKSDISPEQMLSICNELRQFVDFVLIDSPAGIEHGFQCAIAPADQILIVTTSDVTALRDADKVIYLLERDLHRRPGLILNRYNAKQARRREMRNIEDVLDILVVDLLGVVPEDSNILVTTDKGTPAVLDKHIRAGTAYRNIGQRLLGNNVPLMRFEEFSWNPFKRLFGR